MPKKQHQSVSDYPLISNLVFLVSRYAVISICLELFEVSVKIIEKKWLRIYNLLPLSLINVKPNVNHMETQTKTNEQMSYKELFDKFIKLVQKRQRIEEEFYLSGNPKLLDKADLVRQEIRSVLRQMGVDNRLKD